MAKTNGKTKKKQVIVPAQHIGMISNADVQSRIIYVRDLAVCQSKRNLERLNEKLGE